MIYLFPKNMINDLKIFYKLEISTTEPRYIEHAERQENFQ